ncbi:MAG: hypothetical protein ACYSSI_10155 [Planctomycetota bacterium]|jgi:hypothetical protein
MVTMQPPIRTGDRSVLLKYSSDLPTPTFYIYVDGVLVAETAQTEYTIVVSLNENVIVEILDDADAQPMQIFPGKLRVGWFFVEDTDYYRVEEYISSQWVERKRLPENNGYLTWESRFLEDGQDHTFRVIPVGTNGNDGTEKQFTVLMVRHPDTPDVSYSYSNQTNKVTISEN